jgi:hypothetical protein
MLPDIWRPVIDVYCTALGGNVWLETDNFSVSLNPELLIYR